MNELEVINKNEYDEYSKLMIGYASALKILETELEILSNEFEYTYNYNPVEHIKSRIKSFDSIIGKLNKKGLEVNLNNIEEHIHDVVGIRIVCSFIKDIYTLVDIISKSNTIEIIEKKDYVLSPKPSGYSSYHLIVNVPVNLSSGPIKVNAEIQIRTIAMDFWASLEHKIKYKFPENIPDEVKDELIKNAKDISKLDKNMSSLMDKVNNYKE